MRTFLILAVFSSSCCFGQNPMFQIISVKGNVTLDGSAVSCGQRVNSKDKLLTVSDKKSYVSILTENGYAFKLGRGKHKVEDIADREFSNLTRLHPTRTGGAVAYSYPRIRIMAPTQEHSYFLGDSLTLIWHSPTTESAYRVKLMNIFEEHLIDTTLFTNSLVLSVKQFKDLNPHFVIQIISKNIASISLLAKSPAEKNKSKYEFDTACVSSNNFIEKQLFLAGLSEIHNLYYDQIQYLYSLYRYSSKTGVAITHPYYHRMIKEYDLEWFLSAKK